jgi:biopolymer transport protein ExbB/TolQ
MLQKESNSLSELLMGGDEISQKSKLFGCISRSGSITKELLDACKNANIKDATVGMTFLSISASTAPFIGLFGTVVSILETFSGFGDQAKVTLNYIAPLIGEALIATAAGIFVAIFAYTFHQIIKREVFKLNFAIQTQIDLILSKN